MSKKNDEDKLPEDQLDALEEYWGAEYEKDAQQFSSFLKTFRLNYKD